MASLQTLNGIQPEVALGCFKEALQIGRATLQQRYYQGESAVNLVHDLAALVDHLLCSAWHNLLGTVADSVVLVAVGGYGRSELHPGSDIDILLLVPEQDPPELHGPIEKFLAFLWDVGLEPGHSVRTLSECVHEATKDLSVITNLMEARRLVGSVERFAALCSAIGPKALWSVPAFFEGKRKEQQARYKRFHDTAYKLEPNVKEGPGGLRDIQMIGWVAKRHFGSRTLHDLVAHNFLTETEFTQLWAGQEKLWRIRFALHLLSKREDRLLFDHQRTLATQFGFQDDNLHRAVEAFMQDYFRTVMALERLNEMLLQLFQEAILPIQTSVTTIPINAHFQAHNHFLEVCDAEVFRRDPCALLELFLVLEQHPNLVGVRATTIRLIRAHLYLIDNDFRCLPRARQLFVDILRQPQGLTHELRRMNRYGVLAAYLPVFERIVGRMQHDLFHIYTVDEHTLFVVRNLRRMAVAEFMDEFPLGSELIQALVKPELLYMAGLFHDIAKGRGGDHSILGQEEATLFCQAHGLNHQDTHMVSWLVRQHLVMSTTAQRKDVSDPKVIYEFASLVGDQTRLCCLYLLTVADIRATDPSLWTTWKDSLLKELYQGARRALRRGLEHPIDQAELLKASQEDALALLAKQNIDKIALSSWWDTLGPEYFLRYSPDEIAWHTQALYYANVEKQPLVLVRSGKDKGGTEIFLYTSNISQLFGLSVAVLDRLNLSILDARIITSSDHHALHTYRVQENDGQEVMSEVRCQEVVDLLQAQLQNPFEIPLPGKRRIRRQIREFAIATRINFAKDENNARTILELFTTDRPGVLSQVGYAFIKLGIRVSNAKVATLGSHAEDVFFITDENNQPLQDEHQMEALRLLITERLAGLDER